MVRAAGGHRRLRGACSGHGRSARTPAHRARGTFIEVGGVVQPAPAPRFSRSTPATPRPPKHGATGEDVLADWGFTPTPSTACVRAGAI